MPIELLNADCSSVKLKPNSFDALFCDPPYGLEFMDRDWDRVVPPASTWKHLAAALKPGAHVLAFGGSRTWDFLAQAFRHAGLEIRDTLCWLHAQGYPKSVNLGSGLGTALKPAFEPLILARKPLDGTLAQNLARWGTGTLNIDACRIGAFGYPKGECRKGASVNAYGDGLNGGRAVPTPGGRFPANVLLDEHAAQLLDEQSGERPSSPFPENIATGSVLPFQRRTAGGYADTGGASRFFFVAKAGGKERSAGLSENNNHPTVKPITLAAYLARLLFTNAEARLLVPFCGTGSEMIGALKAGWTHVTGIELDAHYIKIARQRIDHHSAKGAA